jgi:hypothetical protein
MLLSEVQRTESGGVISMVSLSDFHDIDVPNLGGALRSNADDPISSNVVPNVQPMRIKYCCSSDLLAGCGVV